MLYIRLNRMAIPSINVALIALAQFANFVAPQSISSGEPNVATGYSYTPFSTSPQAKYTLIGGLTNFSPPPECNTGVSLRESSSGSLTTFSAFSVGCHKLAERNCCPPNWNDNGYYTGQSGSCPPGYTLMPRVTTDLVYVGSIYYYRVVSMTSGSQVAITYTHTKGGPSVTRPVSSTISVILPREIWTSTSSTGSDTSLHTVVKCGYLMSDQYEIYGTSGTLTTIFNSYAADALYIFDDGISRPPSSMITTSALSLNPSPASPGSSVTTPGGPSDTPTDSGDQGAGQDGGKSGLSTGAIAGIGVGVGVPVIAAALFLTWWLTRRSATARLPGAPVGKTEIGAMEPGIMDSGMEPGTAENAGGYGGINKT
ncbi:hypothetical protein TWF730_009046 [Orbilia blumenaviensis]|uniref:Mid2 domain-containing protein n=1 Tax=Orbilia blumenaviensis TaxID=1796055 RepID=A0AAV9V3R6_9PEZI